MLTRTRRADPLDDALVQAAEAGNDWAMLALQYATALLAAAGAFLLAGLR